MGEPFRGHAGPRQATRDLLEPGGKVHGRADAGEVEAVAAADIAVENVADVEGHPKAEALDDVADRIRERLDAGAGFARRLQHPRADMRGIADIFVDREHRE